MAANPNIHWMTGYDGYGLSMFVNGTSDFGRPGLLTTPMGVVLALEQQVHEASEPNGSRDGARRVRDAD